MEGNSVIQQQTPDEKKLAALEGELYKHDPLLVLLRNKLQAGNPVIIVGLVVITGMVLLGLPFAAGPHFDLRSSSWSHTFRPFFQIGLIFPFIFWFYLILPRSIANLFITLGDSGTLDVSDQKPASSESYKDLLQELVSLASKRRWVVFTLLYITAYWLYSLVVADHSLQQSQLDPFWLRVAILVTYTPIIYATFMSIVWCLVAQIFVYKVFRIFPIHIKALHADGSAGLGVLGRMLVINTGVLVAMGAAALSFLLTPASPFSVEGVGLGFFYCLFVPVMLIGWIVVPHRAMLKARDAILQGVADEFQRTVQRTTLSIECNADTVDTIEADTRRLTLLKARYEFLKESYPTWPLEIVWIRREVIVVILPAIGALLPSLIQWMKQILPH